jgi:hypothetical protein
MPELKIAVAQITTLPCVQIRVPLGAVPGHQTLAGEEQPFLFPSDETPAEESFTRDYRTLKGLDLESYPALKQSYYVDFRKAYPEALFSEIEAIVQRCADEDVSLVILPEYSVPWSILGRVGALAHRCGVSVVAGTHSLSSDNLRVGAGEPGPAAGGRARYPYSADVLERIGSSFSHIGVCPVFSAAGGPPSLVFKQIPSRFEPDLDGPEDPGRPLIALPARGKGGVFQLALAICSEFVREPEKGSASARVDQVQIPWEQADVIAVPAWTPSVGDFHSEAARFMEERRHGGPVSIAFSNTALYGGSAILSRADSFTAGLEKCVEGLVIRTARFGAGAGAKHEAPQPASQHVYFVIRGPTQERLWDVAAAAQRDERDKASEGLARLPADLPYSLEQVRTTIKQMMVARDPIKLELDEYLMLSPDGSVTCALFRLYATFKQYFAYLVNSPQWRAMYNEVESLVNRKIPVLKQLGVIEVTLPGGDQLHMDMVGSPAGRSESGERAKWAKYVSVTASAEEPNFGLRIVSLPGEDAGVAYQTRFVAQVIDMLTKNGSVSAMQLRVVSGSFSGVPNVEIFLLFSFVTHHDVAEMVQLAQEVYRICVDRLLAYKLEPVDLQSPFFRDFGGDTLPTGERYSEYYIRRTTGLDHQPLAFCGRGEASSIVKLLAGLDKINRFTLTLHRVAPRGAGALKKLAWPQEEGGGAQSRWIQGTVETPVLNLQLLQDAAVAVSFQPSLFMPDGDAGRTPVFRARVKLESCIAGLDLIPRAIGLELAGPDRYLVSGTPEDVQLSEREVFHVLKLPFGRVPGFSSAAPESLSLSKEEVPPADGLLIGDVAVKNEQRMRFFWNDANRAKHMYVLGKTGTGKSYYLASLISRDIEAGHGVMVLDPHGDLIDAVLARIPRERIGDVQLFDPGDTSFPPGLNLLEFNLEDPFQRSLVIEEAVSIFLTLYGPEIFGPRIQQYFRGAVMSLMDYGAAVREFPTLLDVALIFLDDAFQEKVKAKVVDPVATLFWKEFDKSASREKQEIIPYFQSKFGPLISNRMLRNIVGQRRSLIRFDEAIDRDAIILVNLSKGKIGDINANLLGLILIAKLNWAIMARAHLPYERRRLFSLYVDEFQNVASTTFSAMLSEARKYGLSMVLANQYLRQLRLTSSYTRVDMDHLVDAVLGNVGTIVCFQGGREDAQRMALEMAVPERLLMPGGEGNPILNLPSYQALLSTVGGGKRLPPCYLYSLLWDGQENKAYGKQVDAFVKNRNCLPVEEVEEEVNANLRS